MQTATCKCGKVRAWGEMQPCSACKECGTAPGYGDQKAEPHYFVTKYDQNNGNPFLYCRRCGHVDKSEQPQESL